jgi:hypothetical protein
MAAFGVMITLIVVATLSPAGAGAAETMDDVFAKIASRVPGFGGVFFDAHGTLTVHLVDPAQGLAAERSIRAVLGREVVGAGRIRVLPGQYGFLQLKAWHERLGSVLAIPGVTLTDVDDATNRLRIGFEKMGAQVLAVERELARLGIPPAAVHFEETGPIELETSLRTLHRPLVGGLQISFLSGASTFLCTLGFNAVRAGVSGFVINSHCSGTQGGVQNTVIHQPTISGNVNRIGVETVDPAYVAGPLPCPVDRVCRRSDSAFAQRDASVTASQGRIARPILGPSFWFGTSTFRIVAEATSSVMGQAVTKVGRTTGRTQGNVTAVCANLNVANTNITQLCQNTANYGSAGGDSGSPVFRITNRPSTNDVILYGIHWGSGGAHSPIANVQLATELGPLTTCAAGFAC